MDQIYIINRIKEIEKLIKKAKKNANKQFLKAAKGITVRVSENFWNQVVVDYEREIKSLKSKLKPLKKWNGRAFGGMRGSFYVAAYSATQAAKLITTAAGSPQMSGVSEIKKYYSPRWGTPMEGINPEYPSVYYQKNYSDTPKLIYQLKK